MSLNNAHLFESSPDWADYKVKNNFGTRQTPTLQALLDQRVSDHAQELEWAAQHPLSTFGYSKHEISIATKAGSEVKAIVYLPLQPPAAPRSLPLLFVAHGGGYITGSSITEEQWFLAQLLKNVSPPLAAISIEYRLAPESPFPAQIDDCWNALQAVIADPSIISPAVDGANILLAGSSVGAGISTGLARCAKDAGLQGVIGVIAMVPTLCHPDVFPKSDFEYESYDQCHNSSGATLTGEFMRMIWKVYIPEDYPDGPKKASPFLQDTSGLPRHAIFVAGQDPLRDEGLAYAEKLKRSGVETALRIYPGVGHAFGKVWELETTQRFQKQLLECVEWLLK